MKKLFFAIAILVSLSATAQTKDTTKPKADTTIQILLPLDTYRQLIGVIAENIDSKKITKEIIDLFQKTATIYDKPKPIKN